MITLDFANCLDARVGKHGLDPRALEDAMTRLAEITDALEAERVAGGLRWRDLPHDPVRTEHLAAVQALVDDLAPRTDNLIVLGIGGSALGNQAVHGALNPATYNLLPRPPRPGPRLFVLDNADPRLLHETLAFVSADDPGLERTVINVISKSGETAETAAQFMIARGHLWAARGADHARQVVVITDPEGGTLRTVAEREGYAVLPVPAGVGGRFSVLSPVGLFSAAMCGVDVGGLLEGAAAMEERCRERPEDGNPAAVLAWILASYAARGISGHVLMPYATGLAPLADWYRQLWAESLGKRLDLDGREVFAGPTPIKAIGATDQHSQMQLYREGPFDKVVGFVETGAHDDDLTIPGGLDAPAVAYLAGHSLGTLLDAEKRATEYALTESGRPNYTLRLPRVDAPTIGAFLQLWMVTTAYAGRLLHVNAFDQPAVETGKQATFGLMGRPGYESWRTRVDDLLRPTGNEV